MGQSLPVDVGYQTDTGRVRSHNEDCIKIYDDDAHQRLGGKMYIVADGVGGAAHGEIASQTAVQIIGESYYELSSRMPQSHPFERLGQAIQQANEVIYAKGEALPDNHFMATTVVVAILFSNKVLVGWVGDSRAYIIRAGKSVAEQITSDHTRAKDYERHGLIQPGQAEFHPDNNIISRSIGGDYQVEPQFLEGDLEAGDAIVLCSDGLTKHVTDDEIAYQITHSISPDMAVKNLVRIANENGGTDNISVIVMQTRGLDSEAATIIDATVQKNYAQETVANPKLGNDKNPSDKRQMGIIVFGMVAVIVFFAFLFFWYASQLEQQNALAESQTATNIAVQNMIATQQATVDQGAATIAKQLAITAELQTDAANATPTATITPTPITVLATAVPPATVIQPVPPDTVNDQSDFISPTQTPSEWGVGTILYLTENTLLRLSPNNEAGNAISIHSEVQIENDNGGVAHVTDEVNETEWWHVRNSTAGTGWVKGSELTESQPDINTSG